MTTNELNLDDFAVFIISHGRPKKVITYDTVRRQGYSGPIYIIVDNLDKTIDQYIDKYGDQVKIFDKPKIAKTTDQGDNFNDLRTTTHARNACFDIANKLNIKYFMVLDDDYTGFGYRFDDRFNYKHKTLSNLDDVFLSLLRFFINTNIYSIAMAQGGDFIGGEHSGICNGKGQLTLKRKCMNSFLCSTDHPFKFISRLNEDVNTYLNLGRIGKIFFTTGQVSLNQKPTQSNTGGMTETYLDNGTYIKSFFSVIYSPSSVKVKMMGVSNRRLHHSINWNNTVPQIVSEDLKK